MNYIEKAAAFAEKAHQGQKRKDGKPYFTHVEAVANIVRDEWFMLTNIAAFSGRPVGIGAVVHCSLAKHILDCVVECPQGQDPQAWEAAVGGRILNLRLTRPDLPFTWHILGVYQLPGVKSWHN